MFKTNTHKNVVFRKKHTFFSISDFNPRLLALASYRYNDYMSTQLTSSQIQCIVGDVKTTGINKYNNINV